VSRAIFQAMPQTQDDL
jgi:hypothetical protein